MVLLETQHSYANLQAQRNKTDKNAARAPPQLVRTGWCKAVQIKSEHSLRVRRLRTHCRTLKRKLLDIEYELCHSVRCSASGPAAALATPRL